MSLSNENIFNVNYTSVMGESKSKKRNWTSHIKKIIAKNRMITMVAVIFLICLILNFVLIFNFMRILENM